LEVDGSRLRFWLGESKTPLIDVEDEQPVDRGRLGFSTWGAALSLDKLTVEADGSRWDLAGFVPASQPTNLNVFPGWSCYGGNWIDSADGSWTIGKGRGAKIVWDDHPFENGEISVELRLQPNAAYKGGLIARVGEPKVGPDNWSGYDISLDVSRQTVVVADHRSNWLRLAEGACKVEPGRWHHLRVVLEGPRIKVFVDGADRPQVEYVDAKPLPGGLVGLRTRESEIAYRNLTIKKDGKTIAADFRRPSIAPPRSTDGQPARRQAMQALCRVILNLNEFVYVD
jgi:hypothetical protein